MRALSDAGDLLPNLSKVELMDAISKVRLQLVNPRLADLITQLDARIEAAGHDMRVVQALRSWNDQDLLWQKGRRREPDGSWTIVDPAHIVTKAPPGYSWHNFGLAVDVVPTIAIAPAGGYMPDWNIHHPVWQLIVREAEALGLVSGSGFHSIQDWPHLQLTGRFPETPDGEVRQLFKDGGMQAVWEESGIGLLA